VFGGPHSPTLRVGVRLCSGHVIGRLSSGVATRGRGGCSGSGCRRQLHARRQGSCSRVTGLLPLRRWKRFGRAADRRHWDHCRNSRQRGRSVRLWRRRERWYGWGKLWRTSAGWNCDRWSRSERWWRRWHCRYLRDRWIRGWQRHHRWSALRGERVQRGSDWRRPHRRRADGWRAHRRCTLHRSGGVVRRG
jgi:hypothetical protein